MRLLVIAVLFLAGVSLQAANVTWSNNGTDFNDGANWIGGVVPGTGDRADYEDVGNRASNLSAPATIQGLRFNGTAASGYTVSGSSLTLTSTGTGASSAISSANTDGGSNTISSDIILGGAAGTTASFTQSGATASTKPTLVLSGDISSTNAISGVSFVGNSLNASYFTLSGSNSYSGNTTITSGNVVLNINSTHALSSGALIIESSTNTFDNTSGGAITLANNNNLVLKNNTTFLGSNDLSLGSGKVMINGTVNRNIAVTGGTLTVGSIDAETTTGILGKSGAGTLHIQGAAGSNFQGGSTLSSGTIVLGNKASLGTGILSVNAAGTLAASTDLSGANAVANAITLKSHLTLGGANNLTLSGDITHTFGSFSITSTNTGATVLSGSIYLSDLSGTGRTLTLGGSNLTVSGAIANYNGSGTAGNVTIASAGNVSLTSASSSYTGVTSLGASGAVLEVTKLANGGANSSIGASSNAAANLVLNSSTLRYVGTGDSTDRLFSAIAGLGSSTLDASGTGAIHFTNTGSLAYGTANSARTLNLTGTNTENNSLAAAIADNGTGKVSITKNGAGTWVLSGTNTYTGTTTINGTLQFAKTDALYNSVEASWTKTNIIVNSGATFAVNVGGSGEFSITQVGTLLTNLTTTINNNGLRAGSTFGMDTSNAGGVVTYTAAIANSTGTGSGSLGLAKLGTGTLELTANSSYSGGTIVKAGSLLVSNTAGSATGTGLVTVQSGAAIGGNGSVGGSLFLLSGANIVFSLTDTLDVNGSTVAFGGLSIANILGLDGSVAEGSYTLIGGSATFDFSNVSNWGVGNATSIGGGKSAYFEAGSLKVVVIPEPSSFLLVMTGLAAGVLAFRRRK